MADLDVPLGMLYMLEPVRPCVPLIWILFDAGYRSPMVLSFGPIIMKNPEIVSLKYATINYGGQLLISRAEVLGAAHSERGVLALQDCSYPQDLASLYYYAMNL